MASTVLHEAKKVRRSAFAFPQQENFDTVLTHRALPNLGTPFTLPSAIGSCDGLSLP